MLTGLLSWRTFYQLYKIITGTMAPMVSTNGGHQLGGGGTYDCFHCLCGLLIWYRPLCGHYCCSGVPNQGFYHFPPHPILSHPILSHPTPPHPTSSHPTSPCPTPSPIPPTSSVSYADIRKSTAKIP